MKFTFYFRNPGAGRSPLIMALREKNSRETISTGISADPKFWHEESQTFIGSPAAAFDNQVLSDYKRAAEAVSMRYDLADEPLRRKKEIILDMLGKKARGESSALLLPYYLRWATTDTTRHKATRHMMYAYKLLSEFCGSRRLTFDDVTLAFTESYIEWMAARGIAANTRGTHIKDLKAVMHQAYDEGLHKNEDFRRYRREREEVDAVYLTREELAKLEALDLVGMKAKVRDLFLIGCMTAMRWSDYSRLTAQDAEGKYIYQIQEKTKERVIIPTNPKVAEILRRWGGAPQMSQKEFNRVIKIVCQEAGISERVELYKSGARELHEKWELVSSHTARRTAATNMYLAGIPSIAIMRITGHRTESSFLTYIKISKEENAKALAENPFFQEL